MRRAVFDHLPVAAWLRGYRRSWLRPDVIAGVTTAAVVVPQAIAYATLAGLPVQAGLYVAIVPVLVYVVLGTSRALSVSTTSTLSILTASAVGTVAASGTQRALTTASAAAVLAGLILLLAGLLRLGFVADFISSPVLTGFKAGMGLFIAAGQLGKAPRRCSLTPPDRADVVRRVDLRSPRVRPQGRPQGGRQPGASGPGRGQRRRRAVPGLRGRRRDVADGGSTTGRTRAASWRPWSPWPSWCWSPPC